MSHWPGRGKYARTTFGGLSRSKLMSRIHSSRNETTELRLLRLLRAAKIKGWRRDYQLLGKPDFVFPATQLAIFVDGCFWHGHGCDRNLTPKKNVSLWREKIQKNQRRDRQVTRTLKKMRWTVIRIWECTLKKHPEICIRRIYRTLAKAGPSVTTH